MSSITFGSVGDIISVSLLVKDLVLALDETRGSAPEYQAISRELLFLDQALLQVEELGRTTRCATAEVQALHGTAKRTVDKCRETIKNFRSRIEKFDQHLGPNGSGNCLKDVARKIQWKCSSKEQEIAKFRAELTGYTESLKLLLATVSLKTLDINHDKSSYLLDSNLKGTEECMKICKDGLDEVRERIKDNRREICKGNSIGRRLSDRVQWMSNLCYDLKRLLHCVVEGNYAIYKELLALRSMFATRPLPPITDEAFFFEDACGAIMPIPLSLVNSWGVFQAVLESRFHGRPGLSKIRRKEYNLQEEGTHRYIDTTNKIRETILPGTKILQEIVFHQEHFDPRGGSQDCPYCQHASDSPCTISTQCRKCKRYFRRKTQYKSPGSHLSEDTEQIIHKRKRDRDPTLDAALAEVNLLLHFRRICIVVSCETIESCEPPKTQHAPNTIGQPSQLKILDAELPVEYDSQVDSDSTSRSSIDSETDDLFSWQGLDADSDSSSPSLFSSHDANRKLSSDFLITHKIWERLQSEPRILNGDFDLDGLCSDLQKKARISDTGVVVNQNDFRSTIEKYVL